TQARAFGGCLLGEGDRLLDQRLEPLDRRLGRAYRKRRFLRVALVATQRFTPLAELALGVLERELQRLGLLLVLCKLGVECLEAIGFGGDRRLVLVDVRGEFGKLRLDALAALRGGIALLLEPLHVEPQRADPLQLPGVLLA